MYILKYHIITENDHAYPRVEELPGSVSDVASDYDCRKTSANDLGLKLKFISITKKED